MTDFLFAIRHEFTGFDGMIDREFPEVPARRIQLQDFINSLSDLVC